MERATEQLITREMRVRDYDYVYAEDPHTTFASFSYEEMIMHDEYYLLDKWNWEVLTHVVGVTDDGHVTYDMFRH